MKPAFFLFMLTASFSQAAEPAMVKLWPGNPPGSLTSANYVEQTSRPEGAKSPWYSRVTEPTLEVRLPDNGNGTAVVICPGGGYSVLAYDHEGIQVAEFLNKLGVAAIILKYRLPSDSIMADKSVGPLQDVQEAIRTVRRRAEEWKINPGRIGVLGFSAGGHLAASATTLYDEPVYSPADSTSARPDFSILVYPVISLSPDVSHGGSRRNLLGDNPEPTLQNRFSLDQQVNAKTPPTFLVHSVDDDVVPIENSLLFFNAARKHDVPVEFHAYPTGGHGYGLGGGRGTPRDWPGTLRTWLLSNGWL